MSLLAATILSITPILRLPRVGIREGLSDSGGPLAGTVWRRLGANLVAVELALAVVLLVSAALLGQSRYHLLRVDRGFAADHLATIQVAAPSVSYGSEEQLVRLGRALLTRLSALPGVQSAVIASRLPLSGNPNTTWIRIDVGSWYVPTLVAVAVVLAVSALLASYFPARRAVSINPVDALRGE